MRNYVMYKVNLRRLPLYYVVNLIVPCCLLSLIAVATLLLQPGSSDRLGIGRHQSARYLICYYTNKIVTASISNACLLGICLLFRTRPPKITMADICRPYLR